MVFESDRLNYKSFTEKDFDLFYSVFSNESIMRYAWIDKFDSPEEAQELWHTILQNEYNFAVFQKSDDSYIGLCKFTISIKNRDGGSGEIGYFLLPEFWGRGYATEIAKALIDVSFNRLGLHQIHATCNANNLNSEHIMIKAGMKKDGELRKVRYKNGSWDNEKYYSILKEEWK